VIFWLCLRRFLLARGAHPQLALSTTLAGACGSLSLTYGQMAAGHQLSSVALGASFLAAFWPRAAGEEPRPSRDLLLGLFLALAACSDYQTAPAGLLLGLGWLLCERPGPRRLGLLFLGALPLLGLTAWFHTAAFGAPWRTPYGFQENPVFARDFAPGLLGLSGPSGERLFGSLLSPTLGLFFWAPWCAVAAGCLWPLLRALRREGRLAPAAVPGAVAALGFLWFIAFQVDHQIWRAGWTLGPRYITPIVPCAVLCCALAFQGLPARLLPVALGLLGGGAAAAIEATGLATAVSQGFPPEPYNPLVEVVLPLLQHGFLPRNPLQALGVPGLWSGLPYFAALLSAALLCLLAPLRAGGPLGRRSALLGLLVAALLVLGQWTARAQTVPGSWPAAGFLSTQWEPPRPPGSTPF
jgi:hypothetical protein